MGSHVVYYIVSRVPGQTTHWWSVDGIWSPRPTDRVGWSKRVDAVRALVGEVPDLSPMTRQSQIAIRYASVVASNDPTVLGLTSGA